MPYVHFARAGTDIEVHPRTALIDQAYCLLSGYFAQSLAVEPINASVKFHVSDVNTVGTQVRRLHSFSKSSSTGYQVVFSTAGGGVYTGLISSGQLITTNKRGSETMPSAYPFIVLLCFHISRSLHFHIYFPDSSLSHNGHARKAWPSRYLCQLQAQKFITIPLRVYRQLFPVGVLVPDGWQ